MKPQNQPHPSIKKTYGTKAQYAKPPDKAPQLDKVGKKFIQEVTGVFLFLAQAVDGTMLTLQTSKPDGTNNGKMPPIP
jgi:hypothetical protein